MKKGFKKLLCILLSVITVLSFAACGGGDDDGVKGLGMLNKGYIGCGNKHKAPEGDVVLVQVNSLAAFALNESIMPSLTAFAKNAFSHQSFYAQRGDSEGIYSALTSLYAPLNEINTEASYYTLAHLLKENGYNASIYCAGIDVPLAKAMGFDAPKTGVDAKSALTEAAALASNGQKDFVFVTVDAVSYPYIADGEGNATLTGNGVLNGYLNCAGYADKVLEGFLGSVPEDTTVVIYGTAPKLDEKFGTYGKEHKALFENGFSYDQAYRTPLIIRGAKAQAIDKAFSFATVYDLYPTIAAYLGVKSNKVLISGENILSGKQSESERFFAIQGDYKRGYFITESIYHLKPSEIATIYNKSTMEQIFEDYTASEKAVLDTINECEQAVATGFFGGKVSYEQLYADMPSTEKLVLIKEQASGGGSLASYKAFLSNNARTYNTAALDGVWNGTCYKDGAITLEDGVESGSFVTSVLKQTSFDKLYISPAANAGGKLELFAAYETANGIYSPWTSVLSFEAAGTNGEGVLSVKDGAAENIRLKFVLTKENGTAPAIRSVTLSPTDTKAEADKLPVIIDDSLAAIEVFAPDAYKTKTFSGVLAIEALVSKSLNKEPDLDGIIAFCCNSETSTACSPSSAALAYYATTKGLTAYVDSYSVPDLIRAVSAPQQIVCKMDNGYILAIGNDEDNIIAILPENGEQISIPFSEFKKLTEVIIVDSNLYTPEIVESIVPEHSNIRPGKVVDKKKYIVIHNTGNYSPGATAKTHSIYLHNQTNNVDRLASWHYTVDDKEIYHHIPDNENAWHASDGAEGEGNTYGIAIEVCVNNFPGTYEGEKYEAFLQQFMRATKNTAYLVAKLMIENDIGMDGIKQHYDFAPDKKNCPMQMRYTSATGSYTRDDGDVWIYLLSEVEKQYNNMKEKKQ